MCPILETVRLHKVAVWRLQRRRRMRLDWEAAQLALETSAPSVSRMSSIGNDQTPPMTGRPVEALCPLYRVFLGTNLLATLAHGALQKKRDLVSSSIDVFVLPYRTRCMLTYADVFVGLVHGDSSRNLPTYS